MNKKKGDQRGHNSLKGGEEGGIGMQEGETADGF